MSMTRPTTVPHVSLDAARQMETHRRYREEQERLIANPPAPPKEPVKEPETITLGGRVRVIRKA